MCEGGGDQAPTATPMPVMLVPEYAGESVEDPLARFYADRCGSLRIDADARRRSGVAAGGGGQ